MVEGVGGDELMKRMMATYARSEVEVVKGEIRGGLQWSGGKHRY